MVWATRRGARECRATDSLRGRETLGLKDALSQSGGMVSVRSGLQLLALLALATAGSAHAATSCDNDGKVILTNGTKSGQALVYDATCSKTTLSLDSNKYLDAGSYSIEEVNSVPDLVELNLAVNNLTSFPVLTDVPSITKLTLSSNLFTSFADLTIPSTLKTLDLSWNQMTSFDGMDLPSTLTDLYIGGNSFTSLADASFTDTLTLLYVHNLPLKTLSDVTLPDSIQYLSLVSSELTSLEGVHLPEKLVSMDLSENSLTALVDDMPSGLTNLLVVSNEIETLTNLTFPTSVTSLNLSGNPLTEIYGVSFSWSLNILDLGSNPITNFEICKTDYSTFQSLSSFNAQITQSSCSNSEAQKVTLFGSTFCVISDDLFAELYGDGSSTGSSSSSVSSSSSSSKKGSSLMIALICVACVLAVALAVVVARTYPKRRNKAASQAQTYMSNHTSSNGAATNSHLDSSAFNTIFSGGKVTMMGGTAMESSLVKYRIPANEVAIERAIAKGGFGIVHLAKYNGDSVIVKKILPEKASDDRCLSAFIEEIKLCSTLSHPKIVRFIGVSWNTLSDISVVMEFMPNGDLDVLLKKQFRRKETHPGEFDWYQNSSSLPAKSTLALDVLEAIVYLHSFSSPIIHRDLKAKNVLLSDSYEAKLSDFGISREWQVDATMTAGIGTMAWIAPEVLRGERYTEKADIYSFGVILSELSTCGKPFDGVTNALIVLKVTSEEKPDLGPDCPEDIRELALRCLSFNPSDRPSAMVAHYELRTLLKVHTAFEL